MNNDNLITITESSRLQFDNNLIFQNKKSRLIFAFKTAFLFLPFLYLFNLWQINPFAIFSYIIPGRQQLPDLFFTSIFTTLLSVGLVIISTFLFSKKITPDKSYKFIFLVPLGYFITIIPLFLLNLYLIYATFYKQAHPLFAISGYNNIIVSLESVLPIIFLGFLIYLWFKFKKVYAAIFYFLGFAIFAYYIFTKIIIGSCYYSDYSCLVEKALDLRNTRISTMPTKDQKSINDAYDECEKAQIPGKCYYELIRKDKNPDPLLCERITPKNSKESYDFYKSFCYVYVAPKLKDISLCDKIDRKIIKIKNNNRFDPNKEYETREFSDCKGWTNYELALQNNDTNYCDKIYNDTHIYNERRGGEEGMEPVSYRDCYVAVAVKISDQQVCDKINPLKNFLGGGATKEWCYYNYAVKKKDCSLVPPNFQKSEDECRQEVSD